MPIFRNRPAGMTPTPDLEWMQNEWMNGGGYNPSQPQMTPEPPPAPGGYTPPPGFAPGEPDPNAGVPPPEPDKGKGIPDWGTPQNPNMPYWVYGLNLEKYANPQYMSPKYQLARTYAQFDPSKGVSDELLAALNKLGLGEFYTNKPGSDWLYVRNGHPDFEGVTGSDIRTDRGWQGWGGSWGLGPGGGFLPEPNEPMQGGGGGQAGLPYFPFPGGGRGGGGVGGGGGSSYTRTQPLMNVEDVLKQLIDSGGGFNQGIVNRRVSNATDALERQRKSRTATNRAALASRGTLGSGPEITAMNRAEEDLGEIYSNAVSGIYADESQRADQRMIEALSLATGMTLEQASQALRAEEIRGNLALGNRRVDVDRELGLGNLGLGYRRAGIDEMLGLGNLGVANLNAVNNYNLGLANYGLNRDRFGYEQRYGDMDRYLKLLEFWLGGNNVGQGGYR